MNSLVHKRLKKKNDKLLDKKWNWQYSSNCTLNTNNFKERRQIR